MDFSAIGREKVVLYVREKYGEECVANICNYARWKPKGAIKDIGRVLDFKYDEINQLTKPIRDSDIAMAHSAGEEEFDQVWSNLTKYPAVIAYLAEHEDLANYAKRVTGIPHQLGVHASGVVVTPTPISDWCPVAYSTGKVGKETAKRQKITEWDMYSLEDAGILKLDFLGLNTLDIIQRCIGLINEHHEVSYKDFDTLFAYLLTNLEDKETFKMISGGDTVALFQLGTSDGMVDLAKKIKPLSVEDIAIVIGLYRPATLDMGMHTEFIKRRNGEWFGYEHPKMEKVLGSTKGVLLWQEQCSSLAVVLAGFKPSEADNFRKGIKQKDPTKIKPWHDKFITGCAECSGMDSETSENVWKFIEAFAGYGFNFNHAIAYALLAYMTAYLKCHYTLEYMTAALTYSVDDSDKLNIYLKECNRLGITVLGPEINSSTDEFTIVGSKIQYPLQSLKKLGGKALEAILAARKKKPFRSFEDFMCRCQDRSMNVGVVTNMVLGGCFRKFGRSNRIYDSMIAMRGNEPTCRQVFCYLCRRRFPVSKTRRDVDENGCQCPYCGSIKTSVAEKACRGRRFHKNYVQQLVFGFTAGHSRLKAFTDIIARENANALAVVEEMAESELGKFAFEVTNIKKFNDRNGNEMAFVDITDGTTDSSLTIFSSNWETLKEELVKGGCYLAKKVQKNRGKFLFSYRSTISRLVKC
jgi:DNA polymerase-3 subunit alpha